MPYTDLLQTLAEVAATFAGFIAILVALRRSEGFSRYDAVGLIHFLQLAIGVWSTSLEDAHALHRSASDPRRGGRDLRGLHRDPGRLAPEMLTQLAKGDVPAVRSTPLRFVLVAVGVLSALLNLAVAAGLRPPLLVFAYLFGLVWLLAMALVNFVAFVLGSAGRS